MELFKELMTLAEAQDKKKVRKPGMVAGNMVMSADEPAGPGEKEENVAEAKNTIKVDVPKPRNKQLFTALVTRKGGRHHDPKKDYVRAKEKQKNQTRDRQDSDFL